MSRNTPPNETPHDPFEDLIVHERRPRRRPRIALNLTAMIDVVFLLLIYFMVATEFKAGEEIYRLDLPERQAANRQLDPFDLDDEPLRVRVATTGLGSASYRVQIEGPYEPVGSFDELFVFLRARRVGAASGLGLFEDDHPIVVVPTRATRWDHAMEAFNAAARASYTNITFGKPE